MYTHDIKMYNEDDYLLLSGIQHFAFCRRQWALIHIEQKWEENLRTVEGNILHERAHNEKLSEKRGGVITTRGMAIKSSVLGVSGSCDIIEFHEDPNGVKIFGRRGKFIPLPVEYKRGHAKSSDADRLQLCAQAICLEEMLVCKIEYGYLFYGETKRREEVLFTDELRDNVHKMMKEMHAHFDRRYTPKVKTGSFCKACSLQDVCLPKLCNNKSVDSYIKGRLEETV